MSRLHVADVLGLLAGIGAVLVLAVAAALWAGTHPAELRAVAGWLAARPWVKRLRARHGQVTEFLIDRMRPQGAYGLSFTAGLAGLALAVVAFASVLEDVLGREELARLDQPVTTFAADARTQWLTVIMRAITLLGSAPVIAAVIAAAGLFLRLRTGSWRPLLLLAVISVGAAGLDELAKAVVARPRPPGALAVSTAAGYSFPSGHTVQAAVYGGLAFLLARAFRSWRVKVTLWVGALAIAVLIGLSRVYLGVHWLTDVLGGWALAASWLAFTLTVTITVGRLRPSAALLPPASAADDAGGHGEDPLEPR